MALDKKFYEAVYKAVGNYNQPETVARKMMNWLDQLSDETTSLSNPDDLRIYLKTILEAIQSDPNGNEEEELE